MTTVLPAAAAASRRPGGVGAPAPGSLAAARLKQAMPPLGTRVPALGVLCARVMLDHPSVLQEQVHESAVPMVDVATAVSEASAYNSKLKRRRDELNDVSFDNNTRTLRRRGGGQLPLPTFSTAAQQEETLDFWGNYCSLWTGHTRDTLIDVFAETGRRNAPQAAAAAAAPAVATSVGGVPAALASAVLPGFQVIGGNLPAPGAGNGGAVAAYPTASASSTPGSTRTRYSRHAGGSGGSSVGMAAHEALGGASSGSGRSRRQRDSSTGGGGESREHSASRARSSTLSDPGEDSDNDGDNDVEWSLQADAALINIVEGVYRRDVWTRHMKIEWDMLLTRYPRDILTPSRSAFRRRWSELKRRGAPYRQQVYRYLAQNSHIARSLRNHFPSDPPSDGRGRDLANRTRVPPPAGTTASAEATASLPPPQSLYWSPPPRRRSHYVPKGTAGAKRLDRASKPGPITLGVCFDCDSGPEAGPLLCCRKCRRSFHARCLDLTPLAALNTAVDPDWVCLECKACENCSNEDDDTRMMVCDECDRAFHTYCLWPPLKRAPIGAFRCPDCVYCLSCGTQASGNAMTLKWRNEYTQCDSCSNWHNKGRFCKVCNRVWRDSERTMLSVCRSCSGYVHKQCDPVALASGSDATYQCPECRQDTSVAIQPLGTKPLDAPMPRYLQRQHGMLPA